MADDEHEGPARPSSRGPRVVTGDMMRGKARGPRVVTGGAAAPAPDPTADNLDDPTAANLVGPGAADPAPAWEPIRPRGYAGLTRPPAAADDEPEAAWPVDDEADPEPDAGWPTRSIPPPLHRSAAPPPAPDPSSPPPRRDKRSKPGKVPKPASSGTGRREPLAATAFVLGLASLALLGITAIPALIVAGRAKRRIAGRPGATGGGLVSVARLLAVLGLVAWLTIGGIAIASVVRPDGVDYAKLEVGDCIDTPEGPEVRRLKVRACDGPHDAEVFAVIVHPAAPGDAFPGANTLLEYAANACLGQPFTDYVGIPRPQSSFTEFEIVPESEAWSEGRRGLVCALDNADRSPLTSLAKGSAR